MERLDNFALNFKSLYAEPQLRVLRLPGLAPGATAAVVALDVFILDGRAVNGSTQPAQRPERRLQITLVGVRRRKRLGD